MFKKSVVVILVIIIIISCIPSYLLYKNKQGIRFVEKMGSGWNLGNSLDVHNLGTGYAVSDYETYWGNPKTTKQMIDAVKDAGFNTVRIPVTWYEHMDKSGTIDKEWMDRVQEIVDYVIANDMYAIINIHHDTWTVPSFDNKEYAIKMLKSTWSQIANRFARYDEHLLFEAINEPRLVDTEYEWNEGNQEAWDVINQLNEVFVETIRNSSGNNPDRYLMLPTYCNTSDIEALDAFKVPKDDKIIISIHEYIPYNFVSKEGSQTTWSSDNINDTESIDSCMKNLYEVFISKGIPVIISEFAAANKDNLEDRLEWTNYYVASARANSIMCVWWDEGSHKGENGEYEIFNRYTLDWKFPEIVDVLVEQ